MISTSYSGKVETCYNLALQRMIFCIFSHISFKVNNRYFHLKGRNSISTLHFNIVNFQIIQFVIFRKLSVQLIWGVVMNLIEITYTELSILYEDIRE